MKPLKDGRPNLRGLRVLVTIDGKEYLVKVVTRTRGDHWLVEGWRLPRRFLRPWARVRRTVVTESQMVIS